ncbi:MAG TPA: hypothetical protein EYP56_14250 [Planctomycetaceae bacterium]|nr:hypothetical protein [Planctomycetaceae bacterium]
MRGCWPLRVVWIVAMLSILGRTLWAGQAPGPAPGPEPVVADEDPAVEAVLALKPSTPVEMTRAAKILADLERPDLAKGYLAKLLGANLSQQELAGLEAEFGAAVFFRFAARDDLAPEGRRLAHAVLSAARAHRQDPRRLEGLVRQLTDPNPDKRYLAVQELRKASGASVGPLLKVLADPARSQEHAAVRAALAELASPAVPALAAALDAPDPVLQREAVRALGQMDSRQALLALLAPYASAAFDAEVRREAAAALEGRLGRLPEPAEAAGLLARQAERCWQGQQRPVTIAPDRAVVWTWDEKAGMPTARQLVPEDAARWHAAWLAEQALSIAPDDPYIRTLRWATLLDKVSYGNGRRQPLATGPGSVAQQAGELDAAALEAVLQLAVEKNHPAAAEAAAQLLGQTGAVKQLIYRGPQPAPLVKATRHPDRRVRWAATDAVLKLGPTEPYAGSSYITDALAYFAATSGQRRALVADPAPYETQRLAGYLAALGYQVDTATNGRDLIRLAVSSPDYEIALVAAGLSRPAPELLLQQLRRDPRTASLPVGIVGRTGQMARARQAALHDPLALAFPRPHAAEAIREDLKRLEGLVAADSTPHAERQRQAAAALDWLVELTRQEQQLYSLQRTEPALLTVLYVPQLGRKAATVLGNLGTPSSQRALVEVASSRTLPLPLRQAAAAAFSTSTRRYGVLLTNTEILHQYERYNASRSLDKETQKVLGLILDAVEAASGRAAAGGGQAQGASAEPSALP